MKENVCSLYIVAVYFNSSANMFDLGLAPGSGQHSVNNTLLKCFIDTHWQENCSNCSLSEPRWRRGSCENPAPWRHTQPLRLPPPGCLELLSPSSIHPALVYNAQPPLLSSLPLWQGCSTTPVVCFVLLCHSNSISVISWWWYAVWHEEEKTWAYTFMTQGIFNRPLLIGMVWAEPAFDDCKLYTAGKWI